jgi:cobalt/nickel transport system permease protein
MASVLTLQAVVLGDGGLLELGANILNMGVLPALAVACVKRWTIEGGAVSRALMLGSTAAACTLAAALMIVLEVAVGRSAAQSEGLGAFASQMIWNHALAGLLEGTFTVAIVGVLVGFGRQEGLARRFSPARAASVLAASFAVALVSVSSLGLTSAAPDGYEAALATIGQSGHALARIEAAPQLAGIGAAAQAWQDAIVSSFAGPEATLLVLSTLAAGVAAWGCARFCAKAEWQTAGVERQAG